jgi:hypothetical protein
MSNHTHQLNITYMYYDSDPNIWSLSPCIYFDDVVVSDEIH